METRAWTYQNSIQATLFRRNYMSAVFVWMALGLGLTGGVATCILSVPVIREVMQGNRELFVTLFFIESFLVWGTTLWIEKLSLFRSIVIGLGYAVLNGITWAALFFSFTGESVAPVFYVSAATFVLMGIYGLLTSRDVTRTENIRRFILTGILMTFLFNLIVGSHSLCWVTSLAGIGIFTWLIASDVCHIGKMSGYTLPEQPLCFKSAIQGALPLYLGFMNLILFFLRILGIQRQTS